MALCLLDFFFVYFLKYPLFERGMMADIQYGEKKKKKNSVSRPYAGVVQLTKKKFETIRLLSGAILVIPDDRRAFGTRKEKEKKKKKILCI
jgi:hypothetical protein